MQRAAVRGDSAALLFGERFFEQQAAWTCFRPPLSPLLHGPTARITVPVSETENVSFDAVTATPISTTHPPRQVSPAFRKQ